VGAADATACTNVDATNRWVAAGEGFCVGTSCTYTAAPFSCYTLLTTPNPEVSQLRARGGGDRLRPPPWEKRDDRTRPQIRCGVAARGAAK
jgi:hypothetical protein